MTTQVLLATAIASLSLGSASADQKIDLKTKSSQMSFDIKNSGQLYRCYFGRKLANQDDARLNSSSSTLAYPTLWNANEGWANASGEYNISITQGDGRVSLDLVLDSYKVSTPTPGQELAVFEFRDTHYPVRVRLSVLAHEDSDVFEQWLEITNNGKDAITIDEAASGHLKVKGTRYYVSTFSGTWGGESFISEEEVKQGNILERSSHTGTRTAQEGTPGFILSLNGPAQEDEGEVFLGALAWSGNYDLRFKHSPNHHMFASFGANLRQSPYRLEADRTLTLPRWIVTYSDKGKGEATRQLHRWARAGGIQKGTSERDTLLNSWEGAHFNFDEPLLHKMMERSADMGLELFVLDDGWFANKYPRNYDNAGLGDWTVNKKKLPNGVEGLVKVAKDNKIKFGIWVEPEMVNPKSELYETHPDWVIKLPHRPLREERSQLVLDLSNPAVQDYIIKCMDDLLSGNPEIAYIKWDCNRTVWDPGSTYLSDANQKNLHVDYVNGYYRIMDELVKKHPNVIFQACASGGGRADFGAMKYHHEFWVSDNTDPYDRIFMQWGVGHLFPAISMASHVTVSPCHQTSRSTPLKFRFDVASAARLGFELQPQNLTQDEVTFSKKALTEYKRIRPVVQLGDLYRLRSPYDTKEASLMYVKEESGKQRAVVFAYLLSRLQADSTSPIRLKGLKPDKRYKVTELNVDHSGKRTFLDGKEVGGDYLMGNGISFGWGKELQSCVIELQEI